MNGYQLLGLSNDDNECTGDPRVFTRLSSNMNWILSQMAAHSSSPASYPSQFAIELTITELALVPGSKLTIYEGSSAVASSIAKRDMSKDGGDDTVDDAELDSTCQAPFHTMTTEGALLIMLDMGTVSNPARDDLPDLKDLGFKATYALDGCAGKDCAATASCNTSVTWELMGPQYEDKGKGYTGGLGKRMVRNAREEFGVWTCIRDWDPLEQIACGAQKGELACFWFEEISKRFVFQGLNSKVRLVTAAQDKTGKDIEANLLKGKTLATSPNQAHV